MPLMSIGGISITLRADLHHIATDLDFSSEQRHSLAWFCYQLVVEVEPCLVYADNML